MKWLVLASCVAIGCHSNHAGAGDAANDALGPALDAHAIDASLTADANPQTGFAVLHSFDGDFGASATGRGKPEMNVAANGTQVVQTTWQNVTVYDYTGTVLKTTTLPTLVTGAGLNAAATGTGIPYEPHIVFDEFIQRWIMTASCLYDCVMVSSGSDATTATWQGFYLDNYGSDPAMHMAYDKNGVYFVESTTAAASPDSPCCISNLFAIPSAEMQWTTTLAPTHKNKLTGKPHEVMPVVDQNPNKAATAPAMFMSRTCPSGNSCQGNPGDLITNQAFRWIVSYGTWSGTTFTLTSNHTSFCAGGAAPADQCVHTDPDGVSDRWLFNTPIDPAQPGSTSLLRGAEIHRIIDAIQVGSHVHVVIGSGPCVSGCGAHGVDTGGGDILLWADIDCTTLTNCIVAQTQKVSVAESVLWPTIGVDSSGNVGIFANGVGTDYLNVESWTHRTTDAAGVLSGPNVVTAGTAAYTCSLTPTVSGTGNPVGVATLRDPLDPTALWVTEQYAGNSGDCHWTTRIVEYRP